ncbi:hypothetical protein [Gemmata sp.]|uniref:hypothetical protein n=1 Tax=Gemmata sp. TaxID=1914242 RepID=UPI003F6F6B5D
MRLGRLYLVCPRCKAGRHPLDERLGVTGFVSPQARRLLCLAGASWSFDTARANLRAFCGLSACDNTIPATRDAHGGAMRDGQRDEPNATAPFRAADGDVEFQTDGTCVNTTHGWRELRLSIFARRNRGQPAEGAGGWEQRNLPAPHVRVTQAAARTGDQLGPGWRRLAGRSGVTDTSQLSVIAGGATWIWSQVSAHLPGSVGVLDIYRASEHLWAAANGHFGEGTAEARSWAHARRTCLSEQGAAGRSKELAGGPWSGLRGYFEAHVDHTGYAARLAEGRVIGSGLVEGSCKQVVCRRLKQTGARWKVRRVGRMAALCAVQASQQWEAYWKCTA